MARNKDDPAAGSTRKAEEEDYTAGPLTEADKNRLFSLLDSDPERAEERYEMLRQKLIRYFGRRGCPDAENLAQETLTRAYKVMSNIDGFIFGIAKNVKREDRRKREKEAPPIDEPPVTLRAPDHTDKLHAECRKQCLQKLPPKEQALIIVYPDCNPQEREALAEHLGMTIVALRSKVAQIRRKLEKCAKDC